MSFPSFIRRNQRELMGLLAIAVIGIIVVLVFRAMTAETEADPGPPAEVEQGD